MMNPTTSPVTTLALPDRNFTATVQATSPGPLAFCGGLFDEEFGNPNRDLESTPLAECNWLTLFAYMHRRFGPPNVRADEATEASGNVNGCWLLTTPDPQLFLLVSPSISTASDNFKPYLAILQDSEYPKTHDDLRKYVQASDTAIHQLRDAYVTSVKDLLRPVSIGDYDINALGELDEDRELDHALTEYDPAKLGYVFIVEPSPASLTFLPTGILGTTSWPTFHQMVHDLGNGDCGAGFEKAVTTLQNLAKDGAAPATL